jgi:hypothetical protein
MWNASQKHVPTRGRVPALVTRATAKSLMD